MEEQEYDEEVLGNEDNANEDGESNLNYESFKNTSTMPLDLSVDTIEFKRDKFDFNPDFQRRYVWKDEKKSKFIESLILNVPIPSILLADDKERNKYIIIDGKQRLSTIIEFLAPDNNGDGFKLKGLKVLKELNGYTYRKLKNDMNKVPMLSALQTYTLKTIIVRNYDLELLYFIFARLNSGGESLSSQELRHTLFPGAFSKFINERSKGNAALKRILNLKDDDGDLRMKDAELLSRYYAFKYYLADYKNTIGGLLDTTYEKMNKKGEELIATLEKDLEQFNESIKFVYQQFGDDAFKLYYRDNNAFGKFNRLVFDLLSTWFSVEKHRNMVIDNKEKSFKEVFVEMFNDEVFNDAFKPVTSTEIKTNNRFTKFEEMFKKVYGE